MKTLVPLYDRITEDPMEWSPTEVELPEGYYRVWSGTVKKGDLFLNMVLFQDGIISWEIVDIKETLQISKDLCEMHPSRDFTCTIREGNPVDQPCERCEMEPRLQGIRYCEFCKSIILDKISGK